MMILSEIASDEVTVQVHEMVGHYVSCLTQALGVEVPSNTDGISLAARVLTRYAQTGEVPKDISVEECLRRVGVLYTTACSKEPAGTDDWQRGGDPERAIDCVVRAALARARIDSGEDFPVSWFAALAGLPLKTARVYASRYGLGVGVERRGNVSAERVREWLSTRFENPRYEYMTREFPTKIGEVTPEFEAALEKDGWRRAWADIGTEGTFVVYRRKRG